MAIAVLVAALPLTAPTVAATSNASSWDGYLPASDAVINQTVATSASDDGTGVEMGLAADMWNMTPAGNTWDYAIKVGGGASSRKGIRYSFNYGPYNPSPGNTCDPSNWYGAQLPNYANLGDNEGVLITTPFIWYYGAWYTAIWATENGWITFDRRATNSDSKWVTPTPPGNFPSTDPAKPDIVVAPFWADLHGGQIRWGGTGFGIGYFDIAWVGVQDSSNNLQYFSISFHVTYAANDRVYSEIRFFYCQVQNTGSVASGIENQRGTKGIYTGHPAPQTAYYFDAGTTVDPGLSLWTGIKAIKISAHKYYSDSSGTATDDPSASVLLRLPGDSNPPVVGGVNVQPLDGAQKGAFTSGPGSGASYIASEVLIDLGIDALEVSGVLLESGELGGIGWLLIGKELWDQYSMVWPQSSYQEANPSTGVSTAYYRGGANNEPIPDDSSWNWINGVAWDINLLPTFHWILTDPTSSSNVNKVHYLAISMTLEVVQFGCTSNCKTSVETKSIILTWRPYVTGSNNVQYLDWFARTNPNGHTYTFRPLYSSELPQGINFGYHLQSEANGETGYKMLGWNSLTGSPSNDYQLDANGRFYLDGYFKQIGSTTTTVDLYVLGPDYVKDGILVNDKLNDIITSVPLLTSADGTGTWIHVAKKLIDLGGSYGNSRVKFGIGRIVDQGNTVQAVEWAGVQFIPPVSASASVNRTSGTVPLAVQFTGGASGGFPPYTYSWNFGDGSSSLSQSPSHTYPNPGTYTAMFTVTDSTTEQFGSFVSLTVTANPAQLFAEMSADPTSGDAPLTVQFLCGSTGGVTPYRCSWNFGDGGTDSDNYHPLHTYTTAATYLATVTVTDSATPPKQATASQTITVYPPLSVSAAAYPTSVSPSLPVQFSGSVSGGLSPYSYSWTFGDGGTSTLKNPSHSYNAIGTYTATLTVRDSASSASTVSQSLAITVENFSASISPATQTVWCDTTADFTGVAKGGSGSFTYFWTFDDGATASGASVTHTWATYGTHTATLEVYDTVTAQTATATASVTFRFNPRVCS